MARPSLPAPDASTGTPSATTPTGPTSPPWPQLQPAPAAPRRGLRALVVLACLGSSGAGVVMAALSLPVLLAALGWGLALTVVLLWLLGAAALLRLALAWVAGLHLGRRAARRAHWQGLAALSALPLAMVVSAWAGTGRGGGSGDPARSADLALQLLGLQVLLVLPAIALAVGLQRFHRRLL
ncbi:hypothetical protein [Ideonella livida]|uniref:Uncharacterized protein n=1 Tax=Ideonella livida TaxID=2707176 RepID=A0A7C9TMN1_9BURK|nr:hypothetical protein [Ideonella livida]NDY92507.1 hypothetical protein [Ideonella livida]